MALSERTQSLMMGKSKDFISSTKHSNWDLYMKCIEGGRMFMEGYPKVISEYDALKVYITPLYYHFKETEGLSINELFTDDMVYDFDYVSVQSMTNSIVKRLFENPTNRTKILQTMEIFKVLKDTYPNLLKRLHNDN